MLMQTQPESTMSALRCNFLQNLLQQEKRQEIVSKSRLMLKSNYLMLCWGVKNRKQRTII